MNKKERLEYTHNGIKSNEVVMLFHNMNNASHDKNKKKYALHLLFYISITITVLALMTFLTIFIFELGFL